MRFRNDSADRPLVGQLIWKPKRRIGQQGETFSTGGFGKISIKHNERQRRPFGANPKR
jgi:hypothetical protein